MTDEEKKILDNDPDGLKSYEYIANHIDTPLEDLDEVIANMTRVDSTGQFLASAARYLFAIDRDRFNDQIQQLVAATIDRDREHRYLGDLLQGIYGPDYETRAQELIATDNNFRRIYKRLYPTQLI